MRSRLAPVLLLCSSMASALFGAGVAAAQPARQFEVASVKRNALDDRIVQVRVGPGPTFMARGYTLVLLIQRAYGVMDWNVTGGPDWIRVDRFDVAAKADLNGDLTEDLLRPMLANLLADRFKLRVHESVEPMSAHALEIARGGPKLKPAVGSARDQDNFRFNQDGLEGQGVSMTDFARYLGGKLGLVAVDQTGLTGVYDVKAEWRVTQTSLADDDPREALRAAVFTALESQLGLKLSPKRVPVRTIVIDAVDKSALDN